MTGCRGGRGTCEADPVGEVDRVHGLRVDVCAVAHAFAGNQIRCVVRLQAAAKLGDPDLQCIRRIDWQGRLRPEPVDEHRRGDGPARREQELRQQCALRTAGQGQRTAVGDDLHRPEQTEAQVIHTLSPRVMLSTPRASACPTSMAAATRPNATSVESPVSPKRRWTAIGQGRASAPLEGPPINPNRPSQPRPHDGKEVDDMAGAITTYEESGTWTRRAHPHNGYSSGFSPSRSQWRESEPASSATVRALSVPSGPRDDRHRGSPRHAAGAPAGTSTQPFRAGHQRCACLLGSPGLDRGPLAGHGVRCSPPLCRPPVRPGQGKRHHGRSPVRIRVGLGAAVAAFAAVHRSASAVGGGACCVHGRRRAPARGLRLPGT